MTTRVMLILIAAVLACGSGCAKSDWTDRTLVTTDVTGVWTGSTTAGLAGGSSYEIRLDLEQQGQKVIGTFAVNGPVALLGGHSSGAIDGKVEGDAFGFKQRSGAIVGDFMVNGDQMAGSISFNTPLRLSLRRASSTPRPTSQP